MKAIGYVRRSTDRQEESLDQQREQLETFAKSRGWELVNVYADDAISGSDMGRPGLASLLDHAKGRDDVGIVLTWDRNRLARPKDPVDGLLLERDLTSSGKRVFYASTGAEADRSFASGLMSYVEHYQNGDYLRKLSRDAMRGVVSRAKRGLWPGGRVPYGYDRLLLDPDGTPKRIVRELDDGSQVVLSTSGEVVERVPVGRRFQKQDHELVTLIPSDDARVRMVRMMFERYAAGKPTRELRDEINAAGFRTVNGRLFTVQTIHPMLANPAYAGRCVYNRLTRSKWHRYTDGVSVERQDEKIEKRPQADWITVDDAWPALVDAETFEAVQQRRKASTTPTGKSQHVSGRALRANYLLTGLAFCGICGGRLSGNTRTSGRGYKTRYYVCTTHHSGQHDRCPKRYTVPAEPVERHVFDLIRADLDKLRDDDALHEYVAAELERASGGQSAARQQLQRRQAELDRQAAKLRDHLLSMDAATAKGLGMYDQAEHISEERADVERELAKLAEMVPNLPDTAELRSRACGAFDELEAILERGTLEEKRELVSLYVQRLEVDPDREVVQIGLYPALFNRKMTGVGLEPTTRGLKDYPDSDRKGSANSGLSDEAQGVVAPVVAVREEIASADPELSRIIDAWPTLPPAVRAGILAMVDASGKEA